MSTLFMTIDSDPEEQTPTNDSQKHQEKQSQKMKKHKKQKVAASVIIPAD